MKEREVSAAEQLEARLAIDAMRKQGQLWRVAEGRLRWREGIALLAPMLLIGIGIMQLARDYPLVELIGESGGTGSVILGIALLAVFLGNYRQRQLKALLEIVRRLERDRS